MNKVWYFYLGWIAAAGVLGFAISAFFAGVLRLPRSVYLIPYVGLAGLFLYAENSPAKAGGVVSRAPQRHDAPTMKRATAVW